MRVSCQDELSADANTSVGAKEKKMDAKLASSTKSKDKEATYDKDSGLDAGTIKVRRSRQRSKSTWQMKSRPRASL